MLIDKTLSKVNQLVSRIRSAALPTVREARFDKTASNVICRQRVLAELVLINIELDRLPAHERAILVEKLGYEFGIARDNMSLMLRESSIKNQIDSGTYWGTFYAAIGLPK